MFLSYQSVKIKELHTIGNVQQSKSLTKIGGNFFRCLIFEKEMRKLSLLPKVFEKVYLASLFACTNRIKKYKILNIQLGQLEMA